MKKLLTIITLLSSAVFANQEQNIPISEGQTLHQESCIACHIVPHDEAFYLRENRKVSSLIGLSTQIGRCAQNFSTGWFPDEEKAVVDYLNQHYYKFQTNNAFEPK